MNLTELPGSLGQLTQLRELYLGASNLIFLPDWLGQFTQLQTLLPLEPPSDCDEPDDEDRTRIRYEFAVVPGPLLPKLLVRTFTLIQGERRRRRGAILHLYLDSNGRSQGRSRKVGITSSLLRLLFKVTTSCER